MVHQALLGFLDSKEAVVQKDPPVLQVFLDLLEELDPQDLQELLVQLGLLVNQAKKVLLVFVEILVLMVE